MNQIWIFLYLWLSIFATSSFSINLKLNSQDQQKQIPILKQCSCQLIVFCMNDFKFNATVSDLPIEINYVNLTLRNLNYNISQIIHNNNNRIFEIKLNSSQYISQKLYLDLEFKNNQYNLLTTSEYQVYLVRRKDNNKKIITINLPIDSIILTQFIAILSVIFIPLNIKYKRRLPVEFGYIISILYCAFLFTSVYLRIQPEISHWITFSFCLIAGFFCFEDLFSFYFQRRKIYIVLALLFTCILMGLQQFILPDVWYLNNLIALSIAISVIKFIVIRKLKYSLIPLIILWIGFIIRQFAVQWNFQNSIQAMNLKIVPLFFQIPAIFTDTSLVYTCSAFASSKVISIGLILHYFNRVDLFIAQHIYRNVAGFIAIVCLIIEIILNLVFDVIPIMQFSSVILFMPFSIIIILLLSKKRNQFQYIWDGCFHDLAINRHSIKRQQSQNNFENYPSLISDQLRLNKQTNISNNNNSNNSISVL